MDPIQSKANARLLETMNKEDPFSHMKNAEGKIPLTDKGKSALGEGVATKGLGNVSESSPQDIAAKLGVGPKPTPALLGGSSSQGVAPSGVKPPSLDDFPYPSKIKGEKDLTEEEEPVRVKGKPKKPGEEEEEEEAARNPSLITGNY